LTGVLEPRFSSSSGIAARGGLEAVLDREKEQKDREEVRALTAA
jgi:hypothetical protein